MRATEFIVEEMAGEKNKCPPATQDITLNLKNRQKAIDEYGYGPLNPDMPNRKFWMKKVDEWNLDSIQEAQQSLCGNCAAFDIRQETLDCIAQGIDSGNPQDAQGVIDAGDLGYCKFLKFKCASRRTCDAWVTGGPLVDKQGMAEGLNFDEIYGKYLKVTDNNGDPSKPGFSLVTPLNGDSWNWRERPEFKDLVKQKLNDPGFLGDHKYQQIVDAMSGKQFDPTKHIAKENFHDGKNPQDRGDSARHGIAKKSSLSSLDKIVRSKTASPRKKQLAHWQANMRRGRAKS